MSYLIGDRGVRSKRGVGLDTHYQSAHYHRKKVYNLAPESCPLVLNTNLIGPNAGIENQIVAHTGGPNGDEIPLPAGNNPVWPSDLSVVASGALNSWAQTVLPSPVIDVELQIATANPRSGTYHLRWAKRDGSKVADSDNSALWAQGKRCGVDSTWIVERYSARCEGGNLVTWSGYFTASDLGPGDPPTVQMFNTFTKEDGTFNGQSNVTVDLTTGYGQIVNAVVANPDTFYCNAAFLYTLDSPSTDSYIDCDDFVLMVQ